MNAKNPSRREEKPYRKLSKCPLCGSTEVKRLGSSWASFVSFIHPSSGLSGITIRVEFCLKCPFVRKLYRIYPEMKERDWKEFK